MILTCLELNYGFKVYDHTYLIEFGMFRNTLGCGKQLGNIGITPRNMHEKVGNERGRLGSLALCKARSASP